MIQNLLCELNELEQKTENSLAYNSIKFNDFAESHHQRMEYGCFEAFRQTYLTPLQVLWKRFVDRLHQQVLNTKKILWFTYRSPKQFYYLIVLHTDYFILRFGFLKHLLFFVDRK